MEKQETMNEETLNQEDKVTSENETQQDSNLENETVETVEEKDETQVAMEKLQSEKEALNDKYLRLFAEFQNYKRRTSKERIELMQTAGRDIVVSLLPVVDDFARAKKAAASDDTVEEFSEGVQLVYDKLNKTLEQKGLKALESNGEIFNPDLHEAITEIPAPTEEMKGKIIDTVEQGYALNGKIIRYAKVVIGK